MASKISGRALHWVFKIGDREKTMHFYRKVLGMKILRHEEFEKGCEASCNGPYDGKWSKTMVGYGPEDSHFVAELTYNYGIDKYKLGNAFQGITIQSSRAIENARRENYPITEVESKLFSVQAPDGYTFFLEDAPQPADRDPVKRVAIAVSDLTKSIRYWHTLLGLAETGSNQFCYASDGSQAHLELKPADCVEHNTAAGRIAFGVPADQLPGIQAKMEKEQTTILKPLVSLDTPGKATVQVIILADPDDHEICFVGDEAFRELSAVDPKGDQLLDEAMEKDKSKEWFAKKGKSKAEA